MEPASLSICMLMEHPRRGDGPADLMDEALRQILEVFKEDIGLPSSIEELIAGSRFSAFGLEGGDPIDPTATAAEQTR